MNKEQFKGKWNQFKGEVKQQYGNLTDNDLIEIEGDYDKFKGKVQERYGDQKETVEEWTDQWHKRNP